MAREGDRSVFEVARPRRHIQSRTDDVRTREGITALVKLGKQRGFVCPADVARLLPPEALDPTGLTQLLLVLESCQIELVDNDEANRRSQGAA
jgi:hypothetical protein